MLRTLPALLSLAACAPDVDPIRHPRPRDRALDRAWKQVLVDVGDWRASEHAPGVAVAVLIDGRVRYAEGFGLADGEPVHPGTVFRWASISKPFVATAVLQAEEQGLLSLDDPLSSWLPDFRPDGPFAPVGEPLLSELLTHRSGLADRLVWRCDVDDDSLRGAFASDAELPLLAPPGAFYNYSNTGFSALGAVLEQVHGIPFVDLIDREVLEPAGLRQATFSVEEAEAWDAGAGLGGNEPSVVMPVERYDCAVSRPAAWLHADVLDVARFVEQLDEGPIAQRMTDTYDTHFRADGGHRVGPGLFDIRYRDAHPMWSHNGWVTGFTSELAWLPEERVGVVVVANRGPADIAALRSTILDRFLGYDPATPRRSPVRDQARRRLAGTYRQPVEGFAPDWATGQLEVTWHDDGLWLRTSSPSRPEVELVQTDGDAFAFAFDGDVWPVRFLEHDDRTWMLHRDFVARRDLPEPL